ncbi:class I tRNA ligase family protein, partial [Mycoplasmopsis bovis]|uniref:class I tRNA ligase family protein n=1 Tax=Mycoplasmopsis bovis TaxID=28903 RepID=UPI003D29E005
ETYWHKFREQWLTLGIGLDYERERFTLDKLSNDAVNKVFIELYNKGLIYRDTKAINWDPVLKTALLFAIIKTKSKYADFNILLSLVINIKLLLF